MTALGLPTSSLDSSSAIHAIHASRTRCTCGSSRFKPLETAFAKSLGVPLFLANVSQQIYQMARAQGFAKEDGASIIKVYEQMAGVRLGPRE